MKIRVSPDVIRLIAIKAALDVEGVTRSAPRFPLGRDQKRGVSLRVHDSNMELEMHLAFRYGVDLLETARAVQETVKRAVENQVGVEVSSIDIVVEDVDFLKSNAAAKN